MLLKGGIGRIYKILLQEALLDKIKNQYSETGSEKTDQKNTVRRSKDFLKRSD
jgi:hypothetical protein